jgi:hypothetical protein
MPILKKLFSLTEQSSTTKPENGNTATQETTTSPDRNNACQKQSQKQSNNSTSRRRTDMSMGYGAGYADVVEESFVKKHAPSEFKALWQRSNGHTSVWMTPLKRDRDCGH